jgi:hypothetical protein
MCFGGGKPTPAKSASEFYAEMKPSFGELPSLRDDDKKVDRKGPEYKKVEVRKGGQSRSLLNPYMGNGNGS